MNNRGKEICQTLKDVRCQIAQANDIDYQPGECHHQGDCLGSCPKCEAEVKYIEQQLHLRRLLGRAVSVVGVSAGLAALTSFAPQVQKMNSEFSDNPSAAILPSDSDRVFNIVGQIWEIPPSFPGGIGALLNFLSENISYPKEAEDDCISGRVVVSFIVEKDGSLTAIHLNKSVHPLLDQEALRVVSLMPKWIPAKFGSEIIRMKFNLPITFRLDK